MGLGIDVAAELRTLTESTLQGPWQVPAEVVRWAVGAGAEQVGITVPRRGLRVSCPGVRPDRRLLDSLLAAVDRARPDPERHRAIAEVERADALALLWLAARGDLELDLPCEDGRVRRLELRSGAAPRLLVAAPGAPPAVTARRSRLEPARAEAWLRSVARFAPLPVELDGRPLGSRFPGGLFTLPLGGGLQGEVCVASVGETPELWLLRHGLVAARASVPGYPPFQAAIEMGAMVAPPASGAALREAVTPWLPGVVAAAAELFVRLGERAGELDEATRRRVARLLLEAASLGLRWAEAESARLLRAGGGGLLSVAEVRELARRGRLRLAAAGEEAPAGTVVLDPAERAALLRLVPQAAAADQGAPRQPEGLGFAARQGLRRAAEAVRRTWGRPLDRGRLEPAERRFLAAVAAAWPEGPQLELRAGSGPTPATAAFGRVVLGRDCEAVRDAVRRVAADPAWLYPALLALVVDPRPPATLRDRWLERRGLDPGRPLRV